MLTDCNDEMFDKLFSPWAVDLWHVMYDFWQTFGSWRDLCHSYTCHR